MNGGGTGPTLVPGIAEAICERILRGELAEGEVIHQTELAKELGVSPVPLREALRRLEAEGLVAFLPYRGTIVAPITEAEVREGFAAAIALGLIMLPEALPRLKAAELEALERLAHRLDGGDAGMEELLDFYLTLLRPAGMDWLLELFRKIVLRCIRFFPLTQENRRRLRDASPTRLEMVAAFRSGDAEAARRAFVDYHAIRRDGLIKALAQREWKQ